MAEQRFRKTEAGRREIGQRAYKLAPGLRSLLVMIDGQRSGEELAGVAAALHAPADALAQLAALGLIEAGGSAGADASSAASGMTPAERYLALYTLFSEGIRAHLGLKGYFLQLKVERCTDAEALAELLPEMATALTKAKDHAFASRWLDDVRASAGG